MTRQTGKRRFSSRYLVPPLLLFALLLLFASPLGRLSLTRKARYLDCSDTQRLGDDYGGWVLCRPITPTWLKNALVYTIGVGRNIEWDRAMIKAYHTNHHGWDPTPTADDFVQKVQIPARFHFHPIGLAPDDGNLTLKLPTSNGDSFTIMEFKEEAREGTIVDVPVWSLLTMMRNLRHSWLAILKVDIEGGEFDVLDKWLADNYTVPADQVLIEFHERYFRHWSNWSKLVPTAITTMDKLGFKLIHRTRLECSFARKGAIVDR